MSIDGFLCRKLERVRSTFVDTFNIRCLQCKLLFLIDLGNSKIDAIPGRFHCFLWLKIAHDAWTERIAELHHFILCVRFLWWLRTPKGRLTVKNLHTSPSEQTANIFYNRWELLRLNSLCIEFVFAFWVLSSFFTTSFLESLFFPPPERGGGKKRDPGNEVAFFLAYIILVYTLF